MPDASEQRALTVWRAGLDVAIDAFGVAMVNHVQSGHQFVPADIVDLSNKNDGLRDELFSAWTITIAELIEIGHPTDPWYGDADAWRELTTESQLRVLTDSPISFANFHNFLIENLTDAAAIALSR
ncbi:MAG: hypothetical protein ABIG71_00135 [Candidatus Uhrbacteria bacterium]